MRHEVIARLVLGLLGICTAGSVAGMGLANYASSGSFEFYKQQRTVAWQPELPAQPTVLESTDLAFASDRPGTSGGIASDGPVVSLDP